MLAGCVLHRHTRKEPKLHCLPREREGARDERLAGDDRRRTGEYDERVGSSAERHLGEKRVRHRRRVCDHESALAEVRQHEGRHHEAKPRPTYGGATEVAHVGVEGFAPGHGENNCTEDRHPRPPVTREVVHGVMGRNRLENDRCFGDPDDTQQGQRREPQSHDRPKQHAKQLRSAFLHPKQREEDRDGDHDHAPLAQLWSRKAQALHRREH
jgi:hypothetical protein